MGRRFLSFCFYELDTRSAKWRCYYEGGKQKFAFSSLVFIFIMGGVIDCAVAPYEVTLLWICH